MGTLEVESVYKRYGDVVAVNDMNLDIQDGEFIALVGPSGCGKSTTLEMVAGLTTPSEGTISIAGTDVTDRPPKDRGIAMVFQNIALFPHMDVYDNISYGLRLRKLDTDMIDERVDHAVDILKLDDMLDRMPSELSGGQRQRVAIGRAIVREPDVFLMDEPLANLDAKLRVHMRTELQRIQRELDVTTIYVTHDQEEAMTMADRIAVLNRGRLQQIAPPLVCYNQPANQFVAGFIGSPSMNFVDVTVTETGYEASDFSIEHPGRLPDALSVDDDVVVGIRPEDVYLSTDSNAGASHLSGAISSRADVIEPMGDEILCYLLTGEQEPDVDPGPDALDSQLLMSVDPSSAIQENDDLEVVLDLERVHLFDAETGEAIVHGLVGDGTATPSQSRASGD
jgi:multiple sugar transport system ATP-binding protein